MTKILRLHDFIGLAPGTVIKGRRDGREYLFLSCTLPEKPGYQGSLKVHDLNGDELEYDETELIHDYPFSEITKQRRAVKTFERSDGYTFLVWKEGKSWRLVAGCVDMTCDSLDELKTNTDSYWHDDHKCFFVTRAENRARRAVNQETRYKLATIFKELATKKPIAKKAKKAAKKKVRR